MHENYNGLDHDSGINLGADQNEAFTSSHLEERQRSHQSCTSR